MATLNKTTKIAIGWGMAITAAVVSFAFAKKQVDKQRVESMKSRRRMRDSNIGDYQPERFRKDVYDYTKKT
ncbi:uncharacterized protein LOC144450829 [Glandiceps talaboti]